MRRVQSRVEQLSRVVTEVIAIYLHGSWASEYARDDSDLDLAILADRPLELSEKIKFQQYVASRLRLDEEIDLADLLTANTVFAAVVITSGERIYSVGMGADTFEMKTLAAYARLNEEREGILQSIIQRGTIYAQREVVTI